MPFDPDAYLATPPASASGSFDPDAYLAKPQQPSMLSDIGHSALSGAEQGAVGVLGLPGDITALGARGIDYLTGSHLREKMGAGFGSARMLKNIQDAGGSFYQPQTTAGEYAQTAGEFLPAMATPMGEMSLGAKLLKLVAAPAVASETAGQLTKGTGAEPYARAVAAIASPALLTGARRAVTPLPISSTRQAAIDTLRQEGVTDLTAGDITGRNALRYRESEIGGPRVEQMAENRKEQFTRAALRRVGEDASRATPEVIDGAFDRIGSEFDRLSASTRAPISPAAWQNLQNASVQYQSQVAPAFRSPIVEKIVKDIGDAAVNNNGIITGDVYKSVRSDIQRAHRGAADENLKIALGDVRNVLDDAMQSGMNRPQDVVAWQRARSQYRDLLTLTKAATGAGSDAASGLISPSALRNAALSAEGKQSFARGRGNFTELARAGEQILKPLPNSGTASRLASRGISAAPALVGAAIGGSQSRDPYEALLGGLAGAAASRGLGRAILSRPGRAMLANQAFPPPAISPPWLQRALLNAALSRPGAPSSP